MDELYIKVNDLEMYPYIKEYFSNKDIITVADVLDALDYELERQHLAELLQEGKYEEVEEQLPHFRRNYGEDN